jgi:hypothetical protein
MPNRQGASLWMGVPVCAKSSFGDFIPARLLKSVVSGGIIALVFDDETLPILRQRKGGNYLVLQIETQTLNRMRAAWTVTTSEEGEKRLEQLARFLEHDYESAARSLRESWAVNLYQQSREKVA